MVIVKFISDKDCQLFIDMELVGEVHADNMLKLSLETGSFLVEAKTTDGKCLKKYELNIGSTDCQILQELILSTATIEETIEKVRNDSSLRFYNHRAAFCHDGKYGYINSQYEVVISPIYSYATAFVNDRTLVKRLFPDGEKATIIDTEGNICLDQWYDYVGGNYKTSLLRSGSIFYVLSHDSYSFIDEYQNARYDGKSELIPVHKEFGVDDMYGFIDKTGTEVIPFIYDHVWNFEKNGLAKVMWLGCINYIGKDGLGTPHVNSQFEPIKKGGGWLLYCQGIDDYLKEDGNIVECERIFLIDDHYCAYRSKGVCKFVVFNNNKDKVISFDADAIIVNFRIEQDGYCDHDKETINNIIIKKDKKYGIVDLTGKTILPIEYDFIEPTEAVEGNIVGNIGIIWKDGKCSFVRMSNGTILEPFKYENIIVNEANSSIWLMWSTYLVKEKGKYGCVDFERKPLLPSIYDAIDFKLDIDSYGYHYKMLLYKDGKVGTYEYCNYRSELNNYHEIEIVFSVEPEYDECVFLKHKDAITNFAGMSYVAVRKKDKWGIIDNKPVGLYYYYTFSDRWRNLPNLKKLEFKYNSLEELKNDADAEFERRRMRYNEQHRVCYDDNTKENLESDIASYKQKSYENFKKEVEIELYKLYPDRKRNQQLMRESDYYLLACYEDNYSPSEAIAAIVSGL